MNENTSKKAECLPNTNGSFVNATDAVAAVPDEKWKQLAKLAEFLLNRLREDPRIARYLAGVRGEEIVGSAVLAIQLNVVEPGTGRAVNANHLENSDQFYIHLEQIVRSLVSNFRRHEGGRVAHEQIGAEISDGVFWEPSDSANFEQELAIRDLLRVLLPRVFQDLRHKPKQLAVMMAWTESLGCDDILPAAGQTKFVRHCVRTVIRKHLRDLAASDLNLKEASGKELLF